MCYNIDQRENNFCCSSQHYVMQLLKDFEIDVYPQYMDGKNKLVMFNLSDIRTYSGLIPRIGLGEILDTGRTLNKVEITLIFLFLSFTKN